METIAVKQRGNSVIGRPFQRGKSANPKGRPPKDRSLPDILRRIGDSRLSEKWRGIVAKNRMAGIVTDPTHWQAMGMVLWDEVLGGNLQAVQIVLDRTHGKAKDTLALEVPATPPQIIVCAPTPEELAAHEQRHALPPAGTPETA